MKRPRGTGSIFEMKGSNILWIKYHRNGKPVRESSHTTKVRDAERLLSRRLAEVATNTLLEPRDRLSALPFQAGRDLVQPLVEPLRTRVADLRQLLPEDALSLARERLHGPIELP